jgi:hypothetical protein
MATKGTASSAIPPPTSFVHLVHNAMSFLSRSVDELLAGDIKFSAMRFCQAIELFITARLLREHWSLIVVKTGRADLQNFERGDFQSATKYASIYRQPRQLQSINSHLPARNLVDYV